MCKATPYLQGVSVCASVNTLAAIAVDRWVTMMYLTFNMNSINFKYTICIKGYGYQLTEALTQNITLLTYYRLL